MKRTIFLVLICFFSPLGVFAEEGTEVNQIQEKEIQVEDELLFDKAELPFITITANPGVPSLLEYGQAVSVLEKKDITRKSEISLGETLRNEAGVSSSYAGPGASRPIVRGNAGERVRILRNGIGTLDVSNTAEDHQVSINPLTAQSIEVLRGPETLLYGSSAIGGVVNVIDGTIPSENVGKSLEGEYNLRTQTVNDELTGALKMQGEAGGVNWSLSALAQESDEVSIPGVARSERLQEFEGSRGNPNLTRERLANSHTQTNTATLGASRVWEKGYFGLALTGYQSKYGVPGEIELPGEFVEEEGDGGEYIELEQWRIDSRGEIREVSEYIEKIRFTSGFSNYDHKEVDGDDVAARFANNALEGRLELVHAPWHSLSGTVGTQVEYSEFSALGDDVFVPGSMRYQQGVFLFEETPLYGEDLKFLFGGRIEVAAISPEDEFKGRTFIPFSLSSGLTWDITGRSEYIAGLSFAYTERAPAATELYADGVHFGRRIAELGDDTLSNENSYGVDLNLKKTTGMFTGAVALFAQEYGNYINLASSGRQIGGFSEFEYTETRARFLGFETEATFHLDRALGLYSNQMSVSAQLDYVNARDTRNNMDLPRIPPLKTVLTARYAWKDTVYTSVEGVFVGAQRNIGEGELPTDAYQLLNANVDLSLPYLKERDIMVYGRATNLTNEEARIHTSFVKDLLPLPGRSFIFGVRGTF
jgi:iron complex outermembrane recepter protein